MEMLRAVAVGALAGAIYVWPFAASKSYKRLVLSGVRHGRAAALLVKIISLIVGVIVALGSIIFVRGFSSNLWPSLISCCSWAQRLHPVGWCGAICAIRGICLPHSSRWSAAAEGRLRK